jgi:hypothetical protein
MRHYGNDGISVLVIRRPKEDKVVVVFGDWKGNSLELDSKLSSPHKTAAIDFQVSDHQILFSINRNDNGLRDNNECSGFRLNGTSLQTKTACQPVVWTTLNDSQTLKVQALNFRWDCDNALNSQGDSIWIELQSQTTQEAVSTTWQRTVRLRNVHPMQRPSSTTCNSAV